MADKIYETEGGTPIGASLFPSGVGYYLATAEDIHIGDNKSLADYIAAGGGGSDGGAIKVLSTNLTTSNTLQELLTVLRDNGVTADDLCFVKLTGYVGGVYDTFVQLSDVGTLGTISIKVWYRFSKGYNLYDVTNIVGYDPSMLISEIEQIYDSLLLTESKNVNGAINEVLNRTPPRPTYNDRGKYLMVAGDNSLTWQNVEGSGGGDTNTSDMPTIRFVGLKGERDLWYADDTYNHSIRFSIEIVDGALQVGDTLQACGMRTFSPSEANPQKKRKLRRFAERVITEDDLNQRFLVLTVNPTRNALAHLGHNNRRSGGPTTIYFRVRRPVGDLQTNNSGMTVDAKFSNVVPVPMHYQMGTGYNSDGEEYDVIYVQPI